MIYPPDTVIFSSSPADDESIAAAKDYVESKQMTTEDVKIVKRNNGICVVLKKERKI